MVGVGVGLWRTIGDGCNSAYVGGSGIGMVGMVVTVGAMIGITKVACCNGHGDSSGGKLGWGWGVGWDRGLCRTAHNMGGIPNRHTNRQHG